MKFRSLNLLFVLIMIISIPACTQSTPKAPVAPTATAPQALPTISAKITHAPDAESAAKAFLLAWQSEDFQAMYNMLTPASQDAIALDGFTQRYQDAAIKMTLQKLDYSILSRMTNPSSAQVAYRVNFHTKMLSSLTRDMTMNLSLEKGSWRVQWDDGLILPELHGGNMLVLDLKSPTRGNIYDRNGAAVATENDIYSLGIVKGEFDPDREGQILSELSRLTGMMPEWIRALYDNDYTNQGDYLPVGEANKDQVDDRYDVLSGLGGLVIKPPYTARYYYNGGIAPHVTGYVQAIYKEELDEYLREGYRQDDKVGKAGLEKWGESFLTGQRSASLYVNNAQGVSVTRLAEVESKPSQSIYMTIDKNLQLEAQKAIAGFNGALVVMERDTGRVLAMVSSPGFDPNAFESQNYNSYNLTTNYGSDGLNRLYNRATGDGYPLGSVFKVITMAAALESGIFKPEDTLDCQYTFTDLAGETLYDWTYEKEVDPSGILTLPEGLMRSCNPWFYHIGVELFRQEHPKDVSDMARAFGLGSITGIDQVAERPGNIPDPEDELIAARIAIGQDKVQVNPLQVARFMAAVGNGGTLFRPQVVEKITDPDGKASFTFKPESQGTLPVTPENLEVIQDAMRRVVSDPRGTALRAFSGLSIPVFGKTGTAQNDYPGHPHAWFAGYTDAGRSDKPDIAFAVIAEFAGEGSEIAAPIARRLLEVYFLGQVQKVYPWEARINVTRTPTPTGEETPAPNQQVPDNTQPQQPDSGEAPVDPSIDNDFNLRTATPSP